MKKLFKNSYIALAVLALGFSACTDECGYTPAKPSAVETNDYYFDATQPASDLLGLTDTEYTVTVERVNAAEEETISIYAVADEEIFTVPANVTFAAGEKTANIVIGLSEKMEPFKNYKLELSLPMEIINPYKTDNNSVCVVTLMKEDYKPYAKGIYTWNFLGISYYQEIEYSELLNKYRMIAPFSTPASAYVSAGYGAEQGDNVVFTINEETGKITLDNATILSGLIHPSYGSVTANFEAGAIQDGVLLFQYKWTVAAGSFGSYVDQVEIAEIY